MISTNNQNEPNFSLNLRPWARRAIVFVVMSLSWAAIDLGSLTPDPITTMIAEIDGMELVYVIAGEFIMGSEHGAEDESPVHSVYLDAFWIDKTEVTNKMYRLCVDEMECDQPGITIFYHDDTFANHPVVDVTWEDANEYCTWAGRQLPTEAQWEKAARGTDGRIYPWGNFWDGELINWGESKNEYRSTSPVGIFGSGASPYGAQDMIGNVWEWVADWYSGDYYQDSPFENPTGPESGFERGHRGGSWYDYKFNLRASNRDRNTPHFPDLGIGFRCILSP